MISTRFATPVIALLGITLVPVVIHTYVGMTATDGKSATDVSVSLDGRNGVDTNRRPGWVREQYDATDFIERKYGSDVTLFVARGYDVKKLYHHPELGVGRGRGYEPAGVKRVPAKSGSIPVHLLTSSGGLAGYVLLYDGQFIERPYRFHISQALSLLVKPRQQMTLFFAQGGAAASPGDSPMMRVLVAGIDSFINARPNAATP